MGCPTWIEPHSNERFPFAPICSRIRVAVVGITGSKSTDSNRTLSRATKRMVFWNADIFDSTDTQREQKLYTSKIKGNETHDEEILLSVRGIIINWLGGERKGLKDQKRDGKNRLQNMHQQKIKKIRKKIDEKHTSRSFDSGSSLRASFQGAVSVKYLLTREQCSIISTRAERTSIEVR